ncbi:MAG: 50S ribosomal protein L17 [Patescibacteria group bacterium]
MRKFHRKTGPRRSFVKILANNLIIKEKITTTEERAKSIRPIVEKMVTLGKKQQLASFRLLLSRLPKQSAEKVYHEIAPRYKERLGGYLRIIKQSRMRKRDGARMAVIEFV